MLELREGEEVQTVEAIARVRQEMKDSVKRVSQAEELPAPSPTASVPEVIFDEVMRSLEMWAEHNEMQASLLETRARDILKQKEGIAEGIKCDKALARSLEEVRKCLRRQCRHRAEQAANLEKQWGVTDDERSRFRFMAAVKRTQIEAMKNS